MFRAIGCLVVLLLGAAAGWYVREHLFSDRAPAVALEDAWQPVAAEQASSARQKLILLNRERAGGFVELGAGELVAMLILPEGTELPAGVSGASAIAAAGELQLQADLRLSALGGGIIPEPIAAALKESERIRLAGELRAVRPGLLEFQVADIWIGSVRLPAPLIPALLRRLWRQSGTDAPASVDGVVENGIRASVPDYVADARVAGDRVLVYKAGQ